ncbi:uncharacterized protein LOC126851851 [Cataglyphis hispanica]|uniref:uncharacterized protein LOC126851851 n=1 Tax=Cataglyphis hispanica TaxID=1086592 RepID=UPI00217FEEB8|nr:uncharacterized protein LOC126851851 [Cataglyphis hispanica]
MQGVSQGEAELLIRTLPTTGENFDRAWKALRDYYENKHLLVRSYIARFLALQRVKGESSTDLRTLYHGVLNTVGSLESIGRPITSGEDLFVHLVVDLMDSQSRREWENAISDTTDPPAYKELIQFLDRRLHTVESLQPSKPEPSAAKPGATSGRSPRVHNVRKPESNRGQCSLCHKDHYIMFCDAYKAKTAAERRQHVERHQLCFNCLGKHKVSDCSSKKTYSICDARHHSTLHDACKQTEVAKSSLSANRASKATSAVLLATARVRVADKFGVLHTARALIDQGSEVSIVAESLAQRLQLSRTPASTDIVGVGGQLTGARGRVELALTPLHDGPPLRVSALILRQLTLYTGGIRVSRNTWPHIDGIELADPDFFAADPVELLLGADVCAAILQPGLRRGGRRQPMAQRTTLVWILSGSVGTAAATRSAQTHHCCRDGDLHGLVQEFWRQEEIVVKAIPPTTEEQEAEDHFVRTHARDTSGRFVVRLPLRVPLPDLAGRKRTAARLLGHMEHRFARDEQLKQLYTDFMREYEVLGHMSLFQPAGAAGLADCYLPHRGVMRKGNSAKIRVVFNGSSTVPSGASLNRHLKVGPNLLPALEDILLRWRVHRFVLASDIEKMYRQILVAPEDRHLQRILWRYEDQTAPQTYQLNTVTYGLACAPFLALRSLRQLADDEEVHFPHGSAALRQDVYMDDILTGAPSIEEAMDLQRQLTELCTAGGFPLRKWSANDPRLLTRIAPEHRSHRDLLSWTPQESHATLGLHWHPSGDHFSFSTRSIRVPINTKRSVLSLTARLFDPLGWLAPTIVRAKIRFQSTWLQGVDWDTPLDEASAQQWSRFQEDLPRLEEIRAPRRVPIDHADARIELHGFADASERAYAAVIYARTETRHDESTIILLSAKTRVAPLRTVTTPLELCAASLLARLVVHLRQTLGTGDALIHLWSDSTVALGWICGHPSRWKVYVANRVAEIQATLSGAYWHHLPGTENPADCASRGISPSELVAHPSGEGVRSGFRPNGPSESQSGPFWFLLEPAPLLRVSRSTELFLSWPSSREEELIGDLPEERVRAHAAVAPLPEATEPEELTRFSSLNRLLRVTGWCRRWRRVHAVKHPSLIAASLPSAKGTLSASECDDARIAWIRVVQAAAYKEELRALARGASMPNKSNLTKLTPFTDPLGILRVGGRIKHALLSYDERHPMILPRSSHFTQLIIEEYHRRTMHGGVQLTLGSIRQSYWIPRGRQLVKATIQRCVTCVRWRAATQQQLMGDLPRLRVTPARPFLRTGVDYAGPIQLRTTKGRGHRSYKAFVAVFVCLSTKAVHLEVVSDYSADAFLAALKRFTARRGLCRSLHSDCGTNFVGADAQLRAFFAASNPAQRQIADQLATDRIHRDFNPPSAPHFGGLWEAAVKSLKHHLRRVLGESSQHLRGDVHPLFDRV